ncbi:respiratory nitrate reductase subunit gamma [Pusillimonas sp. ANT_WB101]|uniref:respiratory nitrate reductase subunit gamma n=1 Tax=Pusillimonas sp. ANT_WB101 TaxID=2597356 RepID=UPI0011EBFFEA|nr:respiratory nitrate reductase subunit gamma [Pusillimonas sp. ANT_WB101]KAA0911199.1 respiratory nitrate reductase subunit gamma [Pusillimonas sp. ANT_WB101]NYT77072.1 respiratory nitrate reductase subunit gamma [Alcaligenaceae bacterium]
MNNSIWNTLLFGVYPYICMTVLLLGSLIRFDREQYTWKSDSSQLLRRKQLRLGSNLFHFGILIVIAGHFVGFLAPHWMVSPFINASQHQLLAMAGGGAAGIVAIVGLTILFYRRLSDPRIRINSANADILVLVLLWLQLALGLLTVPLSLQHMDGVMFETLSDYVKGIVTFNPSVAALLVGVPLVYKMHIFLGFTIFLVSPFTRLVHIWSGVATVAYLGRPHQIVRKR